MVIIISEPNLYRLIVKSKIPTAEDFEEWIFETVLPTIRKTGSYGITKKELSPMMERFMLNSQKNSVLGYWSMLYKMTELFALPLELAGLILPANVVPDIATGRMFCDYLRKQGINPNDITKKYTNIYSDGRQVPDISHLHNWIY